MNSGADGPARDRVEAARRWDGMTWPTQVPDDVAALVPLPCADPSVTVITPCHDDGGFLLDALASVRSCAAENIEVIVVDDHSSEPSTVAILDAVRAAGVDIVESSGRGPAAARNAGLEHARSDAVLPLDADNLLRPGYVPAALAVLAADPSVAVVHAHVERFGLESGLMPAPTPSIPDLLSGNKLDTCAVIRRSALVEVGGWPLGTDGSEDWALWLALIEAGWGFATVDVVGSDYRTRAGSMASVLIPKVRHAHLVELLERHRDLYAAHVDTVLTNFSAALAELQGAGDAGGGTGPGGEPGDRGFADRIAALSAERDELVAEAESVNRRAAEAIAARDRADAESVRLGDELGRVEAERAGLEAELARVTARYAESEARLVDLETELEAARGHAEALENTRLFTWSRVPRRVYGRLRRTRDRS